MNKFIMMGIISAVLLSFSILMSCDDNNNPTFIEPVDRFEQFTKDTILINEYIATNNIQDVQIDPNGIRYVIHEEGTGDRPELDSEILVTFEGRLLDEEVFDDGTRARFVLNNLINAWKLCIPLLRENGRMTIYVPSFFGFGQRGTDSVPRNAVTIFEIELVGILN